MSTPRQLQSAVERFDLNGAALVAHGGSVLLRDAYGLANQELEVPNEVHTKFRIASMTKPFTSMAIFLLAERDALQLSDPISRFLPDVPAAWSAITLHQLLTHTSGLTHLWSVGAFTDNLHQFTSLSATIESLYDEPLDFEPGTDFRYSGLGYQVLAAIIEQVGGVTYEQFLQSEILAPLDMENTGCDTPEMILSHRASGYGAPDGELLNIPYMHMAKFTGSGNMYSTVDDLHAWCAAVAEDRLISAESRAMMTTPMLRDYACGWFINGEGDSRTYRHGGSLPGFKTEMIVRPADSTFVLVLSNHEQKAGELADELLTILAE